MVLRRFRRRTGLTKHVTACSCLQVHSLYPDYRGEMRASDDALASVVLYRLVKPANVKGLTPFYDIKHRSDELPQQQDSTDHLLP